MKTDLKNQGWGEFQIIICERLQIQLDILSASHKLVAAAVSLRNNPQCSDFTCQTAGLPMLYDKMSLSQALTKTDW